MRLTCPSCSAQYEIPDSVIPAIGREVECSTCAHVWHQPGATKPKIPAISAPKPSKAAPEPAEDFDAEVRPALSRKLDDSVLSILREEAARELTARKTDPLPAPEADHIPAMDDPATPSAPFAAQSSETADPPPTSVILPGRAVEPDGDTADAPQPAAQMPDPIDPTSKPKSQPEPEAQRLPDAARLAATLTRPMPEKDAVAPRPDAVAMPPQALAQVPPPRPASQRGSGYAMGFGLAVMLALGLLAFYALVPRIEPGENAGTVSEWRHGLDQGRLWLHDRFTSLRDGLIGD